MSDVDGIPSPDSEEDDDDESTGLPWPKTWKGSYIAVIVNFVVWIALLITLGEIF